MSLEQVSLVAQRCPRGTPSAADFGQVAGWDQAVITRLDRRSPATDTAQVFVPLLATPDATLNMKVQKLILNEQKCVHHEVAITSAQNSH